MVPSSVAKENGLTVTSACDLGVVCHVGMFLVHAVIGELENSWVDCERGILETCSQVQDP